MKDKQSVPFSVCPSFPIRIQSVYHLVVRIRHFRKLLIKLFLSPEMLSTGGTVKLTE